MVIFVYLMDKKKKKNKNSLTDGKILLHVYSKSCYSKTKKTSSTAATHAASRNTPARELDLSKFIGKVSKVDF